MSHSDNNFDELRKRAKALLETDETNLEKLSPAQLRDMLQELQILQIELELQNDELRDAQEKAQRSSAELGRLFHNAPVGYVVLDHVGQIRRANKTFSKLVDAPIEDMEGKPFAGLLIEQEEKIFRARYRSFFKHPGGKSLEVRFGTGEKIRFHARLEAVTDLSPKRENERLESLETGELLLTVHDITETVEAEQALQQERERLEVTLDSIGDAVMTTDTKGRITGMNWVAENLTGYPEADGVGQPLNKVFRIINSQTNEPVESPVDRVLSDGVVVGLANHTALIAKDGTTYQIADSAAPIRKDNGETLGVVLVFHDVTDEYLAREKIKLNEKMLSRTERAAHIGSWEWQVETDEVIWSDELFCIFGRKKADGVPPFNDTHHELYTPESFEALGEAVKACLENGEPYELELTGVRPDGERRMLIVGGYREETLERKTVLFGFVHDVTEIKTAENKLKENARRFQVISELSSDYAYAHRLQKDGSLSPIWSIGAFDRISGYSPEELYEKGGWGMLLHPDDHEAAERYIQKLFSGKEASLTARIITKSGETRWIQDRGKPWFDEETGEIIGTFGAAKDITDRVEAEETLRVSESRYRTLTQNFPAGALFLMNEDFEYLAAGGKVFEQVGLTSESVVGRKVWEVFPELWDELKSYHHALLAGEEVYYEVVFRGGLFSNVGLPLPQENGKRQAIVITQDITQSRANQRDLQRYRKLLNEAEALAKAGAWEWDIKEDRWLVSDNWRKIHGFSEEEKITTKELVQITHPDSSEEVQEAFAALKAGKDFFDIELKSIHRQTGETRLMRSSAKTHFDKKGEPLRVTGVALDVTETKQAQRDLARSEARLRSILERLPQIVSYVDKDLVYRFANESFKTLLGIDPEEVVGRKIFEVIGEDAFKMAKPHIERVLAGEAVTYNETFDYPSGQRNIFGQLIPDKTAGGEVIGYYAVLTDITPIQKAEEEKAALQMQLHQAQKLESIGRLAGGVAHDFNNLLTGIMGNISLAQDELSAEDPLFETLDDIIDASNRTARLTKQLLAFSRKQIIKPKVVCLNDIIEEATRLLKRLIGENIDLQFAPEKAIGNIKADRSQIETVLINLAVNARDAMKDGGSLVIETHNAAIDEEYCRHHPEAKIGRYVALIVTDTGHGMSAETQEKIFEPFFTTKVEGEGTGLGLATIYGIVKQHEGFINVYSEKGEGTSFKVYLPLVEEAAEIVEKRKRKDGLPTGDEKILVVEDEPLVKNIAIKILRRQGYTVYHSSNGPNALAMVEKEQLQIDMLMTDIVMPIMNGRELAEKLSQNQPGIKILYTSGYTENVIAHHGILEEGIHFISKPYTPLDLAKKVREVFDA